MSKDAAQTAPATAHGTGIVLPTNGATPHEPTHEELEARAKTFVIDRQNRCWQHKDDLRRKWLPRPDTPAVIAAAAKTLGPKLTAAKLRTSPTTVFKVAGGFGVQPLTLMGLGGYLYDLSEAAEELEP